MKRTIISICALLALVSCQSLKEEWQPVFTFDANEPAEFVPVTETELMSRYHFTEFTTIQALKAMYKSPGVEITGNVWIKGQVISSDRTGNIYRELYIQDGTGGIDVKVGKSSLYSDYKLGQWVYVRCSSLTLGSYNGMPQLGMEPDDTSTNEYETSYIDLQAIINEHVFKGAYDTPVAPQVVTEDQIKTAIKTGYKYELWGKYVMVKGLKYSNEVFALLYPNSNLPHKSGNPENRVFLSTPQSGAVSGFDYTWGIDSWALSKGRYIELIKSGKLDQAEVGSGATRYGTILGTPRQYLSPGRTLDSFGTDADLTYKDIMIKYAGANTISQYFKLGSTDIQIRTSGYAKFADEKIDSDIVNGTPIDVTGILTIYSGSAQFTLVDEPSISVIKH